MAIGPTFTPITPLDYSDTAFKDDFPTLTDGFLGPIEAIGTGAVSYGIMGGTDTDAGTTVTMVDALGTLRITKATGAFRFDPNDAAVNALGAFAQLDFTVSATDNDGTSTTTFSIFYTQSGTTETSGDDTLMGSADNDVFASLDGNDTIDGGAGNDIIDGGLGADSMTGNTGNDTYYVDNVGDLVIESLSGTSGGTDTVYSKLASYTLGSNVENGRINTTGTASLTGNGLANVLTGGTGQNTLVGGAGKDTLTGAGGKDTLTGGTSADHFDFNVLAESGITATTRDTISDFSHLQGDKIDLLTLDANTAVAGNQAFTKIFSSDVAFSATKSFTGAAQLYYDQKADVLYGNIDNDDAPEFSIKVVGVTSLVLSDFIL